MSSAIHTWCNRRTRALICACRGLATLIRTQSHAWLHALATGFVIAAGLCTRLKREGWAILVLTIAAVWTAEAFNTALEHLADACHPSFHPQIRRAKDIAAAGVLAAALAAVAIALLIWGGRRVECAH